MVEDVNGAGELGQFFDYLYGSQTGFVYSPTKDPKTKHWETYFFQWPNERQKLINHVRLSTSTKEVYSSPGLFKTKRPGKESFKGTNFIWCEFDGELPAAEKLESLPEPAIKVQSSTDNNQHWYWRLDQFESNKKAFEEISQRLTYHLNADHGCWNVDRVLRPPTTIHHESTLTVKVLRWDPRHVSLKDFMALPPLPVKFVEERHIGKIPTAISVLGKYSWPDDALKLFLEPKENLPTKEGKAKGEGHRSALLTKLGHYCIEMDMSNAEAMAILLSADDRWGKFKNRNDRRRWLLDIINFCRSRHTVDPVQEEVESRLKVYTYDEFMATKLSIEWIVPNLLHKKGVSSVSGPSGVGKSQFSLRFAESLAKGEKFLKWMPDAPCRTIFVSMEMPHEELYYFIDMMKMEENQLLRENMLILPLGSSLRMNDKKSQAELNRVIEKFQPTGVVFDSLGKGIGEDIGSEAAMLEAFDYIDRDIRGQYGAFAWFIHHPRKAQVSNKKPNTLDDLYGSMYFGANITTAISLWEEGNEIEVSCLKLRMAAAFDPFNIRRTPGLNFKLSGGPGFNKPDEEGLSGPGLSM